MSDGLEHISAVLARVFPELLPEPRQQATVLGHDVLRPLGPEKIRLGDAASLGDEAHGPLFQAGDHQGDPLRPPFLRGSGHGLHNGSGVYSHGSAVSCAPPQAIYEYTQDRGACQGVSYGSAQVSDRTEFRRRLALAVEQSPLRQREIAERLGVREATVSDWMAGRTAPNLDQLLRLPVILDVSGHWLLTGAEPMRPVEQHAAVDALVEIARIVEEAIGRLRVQQKPLPLRGPDRAQEAGEAG